MTMQELHTRLSNNNNRAPGPAIVNGICGPCQEEMRVISDEADVLHESDDETLVA